MKKSNKYNLLQKDELNKEKCQQEWIEMQPVSRWENKKNQNSDTSYMKLQEEHSEIDGENVHLNNGNQNSSQVPSGYKNSQQYKQQQNTANMQKMPQKNMSNINTFKQPQQKMSTASSNYQQSSQLSSQPRRNIKSSQMGINSLNKQQGMSSQYRPEQSMYNNMYPSRNVSVYEVSNNRSMYSEYRPQQYWGNQSQYGRQSQFNYPQYQKFSNYPQQNQQYQNVTNSRVSQQNQSRVGVNGNITQSSMSQVNRSSSRQSIPQMTVNCEKCTFTQSVPGNTQMYICCMCNQINECFPLYGVFTCGICMARVIYPFGTSTLIKCTKCQTVNRVNPQPKKKQDENVVMGKENSQQKETIPSNEVYAADQLDEKMKRDQAEFTSELSMRKKLEQPFKIIPKQKIEQKEGKQKKNKQNPLGQYPEIEMPQQQKRQPIERDNQITQQLIDLDSNSKQAQSGHENLHNEIFQLSEKLDQSLVISKEEAEPNQKVQIHPLNQSLGAKEQPTKVQGIYPSIFD